MYGLVLRAVIRILSAQLRDSMHCRATRIIFNLPKDMASRRVLYYAVEIFKLFYKANNNILPDCLSKNIFRKRESSYSL